MEKLALCMTALFALFFLFGCLYIKDNESSREITLQCSNADLGGIEPKMDSSTRMYSLPIEELKAIRLGEWEVINANSNCNPGQARGENKNYLYCHNWLTAVKSDSAGTITDSGNITLKTVFREEKGKFVLIEKECISYQD